MQPIGWLDGVALLPPATKLRQGNVFTPVCHSVHMGGGVADPPGRHPPAQCMLGDNGQQAAGTHSTGMHACYFRICIVIESICKRFGLKKRVQNLR